MSSCCDSPTVTSTTFDLCAEVEEDHKHPIGTSIDVCCTKGHIINNDDEITKRGIIICKQGESGPYWDPVDQCVEGKAVTTGDQI